MRPKYRKSSPLIESVSGVFRTNVRNMLLPGETMVSNLSISLSLETGLSVCCWPYSVSDARKLIEIEHENLKRKLTSAINDASAKCV